ncbi:MAG: prepilin-type N-terminal cleavage/methylation domain-containing protein [Verrucomicrobia subdivision 3 bacterium]|nr:prepilin-type N-terminal cleavage/methylation domain-containing protein [Limisphaerales bacterium]
MKPIQQKRRTNGFTLVEALVAVSILGMVTFMIFRSLLSVLGATKMGTDAADQVQRERVAIKTVEVGLRGMVFYEQNQDMYALDMDLRDKDYPYFSFVSRVPPDYLGSREFSGQTLRRLSFSVEDIGGSRALILQQSHVMRPAEGEEPITVVRSVLAPQLDQFIILFWSTSAEDWIDVWTETNSLPSRVKVEMALTRQDGESIQLTDIIKREIAIHSISITKNNQNPDVPPSTAKRKGGGKNNLSARGGKGSGRDPRNGNYRGISGRGQYQRPNAPPSRFGQNGAPSRGSFGLPPGFGVKLQPGQSPPGAGMQRGGFSPPKVDNNAS